jgi:hypothetical protein
MRHNEGTMQDFQKIRARAAPAAKTRLAHPGHVDRPKPSAGNDPRIYGRIVVQANAIAG